MRSVDLWIVDIRFPWMAFLGGVRLSQNYHGNVKSTENKLLLRFFGSVVFRGFNFKQNMAAQDITDCE